MSYRKTLTVHTFLNRRSERLSPSEWGQSLRDGLVVLMLLGALCSNQLASAHSRWAVPSHTVISGVDPVTVTIDASISNELFYPDIAVGGKIPGAVSESQKPLEGAVSLVVTQPDGEPENVALYDFERKTVGKFRIESSGTYKASIKQPTIFFTSYVESDGERGRFFGSYKDVKSRIPNGSHTIEEYHVFSEMRTYVTRNQITKDALKVNKKGLDIQFVQHPNDLFAKETFQFEIYFDGRRLSAPVKVALIPEGTRFRDDRAVVDVGNKKGRFAHQWKHPGRYLLEIEYSPDGRESSPVSAVKKTKLHLLYLVLEVFPQ